MLTTLRIKNLALVADLTLELTPGFNVITGETGAGKSVILGAINLVLGQRADRTLIRTGSDACTVEAVFDVRSLRAPLASWLDENGLEPVENGELRIRRSFTLSGTNRQFINGSPTSVAALGQLGEWLVDLHGPHEHQSLLQPMRQLAILDAFGGLKRDRDLWDGLWARHRECLERRAQSQLDPAIHLQQLDLVRHQVHEIRDAHLQAGEEETLVADFHRVQQASRLMEITQVAQNLLGEGDDSLLDRWGALGRCLADLSRLDATGHELNGLHESAGEMLRDLQSRLSRYADRLEMDPERLRELEDRINLLQLLKRKYGSTVEDVIAFGDSAERRLLELEGNDERVRILDEELARIGRALSEAGRKLSNQRRQSISRLARAVEAELGALGFKQSRLDVDLTTGPEPGPTGFDTVEFQFAPNPGEPPRPLRTIASSGELARVMLALKTVLAAEDEVPVLIFDEVDANVGGETAASVGQKLRQIASRHQVLCITHLAPVAAQGHTHFVVSKHGVDGRTESRMERLDTVRRVDEIARMLGGLSSAARGHALELLETAQRLL